MTLMDNKEFTQGEALPEEETASAQIHTKNGFKYDAYGISDDGFEAIMTSDSYREDDPDYGKLRDVLPNFLVDLERLELGCDALNDKCSVAWKAGDLVSYFALDAKHHELTGFIKGLNVLKGVLRRWEEYEWGEMTISDLYDPHDAITPQHRRAAQEKLDAITSRALQILSRRDEGGEVLLSFSKRSASFWASLRTRPACFSNGKQRLS